MTITVSDTDSRSVKALAVLASSDRWLKIRRKPDGVKFYVIPSSDGRHVYWTNQATCSCPDFVHRGESGIECKHIRAVKLHCAVILNKRANRVARAELAKRSRTRRSTREANRILFGHEDEDEPKVTPAPPDCTCADYNPFCPKCVLNPIEDEPTLRRVPLLARISV